MPDGRGFDCDLILAGGGYIGFEDEEAGSVELPFADLSAVHGGDDPGFGGLCKELPGCMAANAEPLRGSGHRAERSGDVVADPAVFVAIDPFEGIPAGAEAGFVAGEREVDDIVAVTGVKFFLVHRAEEVINAALVGGFVGAGDAAEGFSFVGAECGGAIGAAEAGLPGLVGERCRGSSLRHIAARVPPRRWASDHCEPLSLPTMFSPQPRCGTKISDS